MSGNPIAQSRREMPNRGQDNPSDDANVSPPQLCLSLWELLLVQSHGDAERQELLAAYRAVESTVGLPSLAQNLTVSKTLNIRRFLMNSCIRRAALDDASINVGPVLMTRMKVARRFTERYRAKFLRWEFLKSAMMHGMHINGVLTDEGGEGSAVSLPLRCNKEPCITSATNDVDAACTAIFNARMELLFSKDALHLYDTLFRQLTSRGGIITRPVYFAVMLLFIKATLVHLSDEDIHKLIAADFEVDCAEVLSLMQRMKSSDPKRRASVRNLLVAMRSNSFGGGGDVALDANSSEMMDARTFQRFCGSLAFVWLEGTNFSELSLFMTSFSRLLLTKTEYFDLDFCQKYSPLSYLPSARSLIPSVDGISNDRTLEIILRFETVKAIFIRFPMYTSAHEEVLKLHTQRFEQCLLAGSAAPTSTTKRRKKSTIGRDGFAFGLRPCEESSRVSQDEEVSTRSKSVKPSVHPDKSVLMIGNRPSLSSDHHTDDSMGNSFASDFLVKVTEAVLETPRRMITRNARGVVPLDVAQNCRHASDAPTVRQVQYKSYRVAPQSCHVPRDLFSSRLGGSTAHRELPKVMQHHYVGKAGTFEMKRRVGTNIYMDRLGEAMKAQASASLNAPSRLLPELRPQRFLQEDRTRAASSMFTYDLGLDQLLSTYDRSRTPW
ncbi:Hypothetical protein, putative [Bodo saltans]|uniref:Uncharacterized protein n=1 Tax=Bodo saltans TaxID=75058 RepID=A0A0S4J2U7_BODSA|nr:Hypothetical protein, putative [Bodo saltans]|eukprot:CUG85446.1 Hypothetical protein, putative [Bodo saltans]